MSFIKYVEVNEGVEEGRDCFSGIMSEVQGHYEWMELVELENWKRCGCGGKAELGDVVSGRGEKKGDRMGEEWGGKRNKVGRGWVRWVCVWRYIQCGNGGEEEEVSMRGERKKMWGSSEWVRGGPQKEWSATG